MFKGILGVRLLNSIRPFTLLSYEFVWKCLKINFGFWDSFNLSFGLCPKLPADANAVGLLYTAILGGVARMRFKFFIQKTRCCFICQPSLAEMDCVKGWTRYKSSRCLYANCARCTVSIQTRVDHRTRMYDGQRLAQDRYIQIRKDLNVPHRLHIRLMRIKLSIYRLWMLNLLKLFGKLSIMCNKTFYRTFWRIYGKSKY